MRKYLTSIAWTACAAVAQSALAHPGHGDAAHFILGGPHEPGAEGAHQLLAHPLFAVTLLVASVLTLSVTAARARSLRLPRPRRDESNR